MSNYYSSATSCDLLKCPRYKYEELVQLLCTADPDGDPSEEIDHGFELEYFEPDGEDAVIYLKSDASGENVRPEGLPKKFLVAFGELLKQNSLKYTLVGVAQTCDRLRPDSHGGYYFRITDAGEIVNPIITWPEQNGNPT